jgi:N-hydroxyarylamine O-acetyltransferase
LAPADIERKLVAADRGGYCFEQNLLLKDALENLGADVRTLLARVRVGAPPGVIRPRTHLMLEVRLGGESWLADVGFGLGALLDPIPFGPGEEDVQSGWRFRVIEQASELVSQTANDDGWQDQYTFSPDPVPSADLEAANWYTSTHPRSPFVTGPIISALRDDGGRTLLKRAEKGELTLIDQTPASTSITCIELQTLPQVLATRFGLRGFELASDGRLARAAAHGALSPPDHD